VGRGGGMINTLHLTKQKHDVPMAKALYKCAKYPLKYITFRSKCDRR
jgi:hypothetical protein